MRIGPGELLLVVAVILILVGASRMKSVTQEVKRQREEAAQSERAAKPASSSSSAPRTRSSVKYPQLQLLGVLVMLAGGATMVIGYMMSQPDITVFSLIGIGVVALGIAFIILSRRR